MDPAGVALHHVGEAKGQRQGSEKQLPAGERLHRARPTSIGVDDSRSNPPKAFPLVVPTTRLRLYLPELNVAKNWLAEERMSSSITPKTN